MVGESGCGKTTTGRTIMKIYEATGGKVFFNNECISVGIPELKEKYKEAKKAGNDELLRNDIINAYLDMGITLEDK